MGSGPLVRRRESTSISNNSRGGKEAVVKKKKTPLTSGVKGSNSVANDPDCGAVEGRVISGLPIRVCNNCSPSPGKEKLDVVMAGKGEDTVHTVIVMGASVSLRHN